MSWKQRLCICCCAALLCSAGVFAQQHSMKAAIMSPRGEVLPDAKLVAETATGEAIRATPAGDGRWFVSGVAQKTMLHLEDPVRGAISLEVCLPDGLAQVDIYWGEKSAEARVTSLAPVSAEGISNVPFASPAPYAHGRNDGSCPADSLFGQTAHMPDDGWSAGTSEADTGSGETLLRADKFVDVSGEVCDIHWYGFMLYLGSDWAQCTDSDPAFEIKFYEDGGSAPGAELCRYTVYPTITGTGLLYHSSYQFELQYFEVPSLDPCCTVDPNGWVSIQGLGDTTCWFLWMSSPNGDGSSYFNNNGTVESYAYDNSFCLTGEYIPTYGACCEDSTATCTDGVEKLDCPPPLRFTANTLCADLDPACGDITTCEHSIVLTDDYGDGWNGGTVDVLVNGVIALDNATLSSGAGPVTYYFQAATGDNISTVYVAGDYSYENEYHIYDVNGTQICADGTGGTTPTGGSCGLGYCEADPCDGNEPANDDCTGAYPITAPYPYVANGTNYCASVDCPGVLDWKATWWSIELPYAVNNLNISFCGNGFEINNVGVVVYDSCPVSCSDYILYSAIDWYGCSDGITAPSIDWIELPGPGVVYFPAYFNEGEMGPYMFEVNVDEVLPPPNDFCEDAIPVGVPSTTAGWTTGATIDSTFPSCGTAGTPSSPGVWYSVMGTGNGMTASLCNGVATYDTKLTVYCPDCAEAICVDGNDDSCGLQSEVSWCSQYGANYLILVHGYGGATGDFELEVFDDGTPCEADVACLPEGACCLLTGECIITNEIACDAMDGEYKGDDTDCGWVPAETMERFDCSDYIVGTIDASSPTWNRIYGCNVDVNCAASCYDSSTDGQYYAVFPITTTVSENLEAEVVAANTTLSDTVMTLYCDPFDPADPMANAIAYDDDGAGYPYSGFYASDGIYLTSGVTYYLVLSTFSAGDMGDFEMCLGGHFTAGGGGPGACCLPDGTCETMEAGDCSAAGGFFGGTGTDCATFECPEIPGACCLPDKSCVVTIESCCDYAGGVFVGPGTNCGTGFAVLLTEDFNAGIPGTWTVTDDDGSGLMWNTNDYWADGNWTGGTGTCAEASSDTFGSASYDTSLITPMLDLSGAMSAVLDFEANYQNLASDEYFYVDVSYDGGANWMNLLTWNEDHGSFHGTPGEHVTLALAGGSAITQVRFRYYDPTASWNWEIEVDDVVVSAEVEGLSPCQGLDIKPGSCPNSFNRGSHGVLPVALVGTPDFDVTMVDIATLTIERADGIGGAVGPNEGPPGPHTVLSDVATPFDGVPCACHEYEGDGILDVSMKFKTDNVVAGLELNSLPPGALVPLVLRGMLYDGTPFVASDCVRLVPPGTGHGHMSVTSNVNSAWVYVSPLDEQLDGGGFCSFDRTYPLTTVVTLTAQTPQEGREFIGWQVNGVLHPSDLTVQIDITESTPLLKAIYGGPVKQVQPGGTQRTPTNQGGVPLHTP